MKPITRNEKEVDRLAKSLPPLTDTQIKWISRNAVPATAYQFNTSSAWCSNCGHIFNNTHKAGKCPHCGAKFTEHETEHPRKQVSKSKWYTTIVTTCEGWQVSRHFLVQHYAYKGGEQDQDIYEAVQVWTNSKGEQVINARSVCMCGYYYDVWNFAKPMSIKRRPPMYSFGSQRYDIFSPAIKVCNVLPILKRNGFDGKFHEVSPDDLFRLLLTDNFAETLQKTHQYGLLGLLLTSRGVKRDIAKICVRHGYIIKSKDAILWRDYIGMCEELGKDIHNPQVCCPKDLKKAHDDVTERVAKMRERRRREEERRRAEERARQQEAQLKKKKTANNNFIKTHKQYFCLTIIGNGITITPLKSPMEFIEEGKAMHHCVGTYYDRVDSLVLSARDSEGKRLETIEIDLKTFKIVQSRGVCNQDSPKHKEIVKLMNNNMGEVKKLAKPRTKKAKLAVAA